MIDLVGLVYLSLLVLQTSLFAIILRLSRTKAGDKYNVSVVVTLCEVVKLVICIFVLLYNRKLISFLKSIKMKPLDTLKTSFVAILYFLQNNIMIYALSNLDAVTFQIMYQLKILTTALFCKILLKKEITMQQWLSLVMLFVGVSTVALNDIKHEGEVVADPNKNIFIGGLCVVICALLSGFSAAFFEMLLKNSQRDLWERNAELAATSVIFGFFTNNLFSSDNYKGFDKTVIGVILLQSFGGLLVALVVKYTDNIKKVFACSLAIIFTSVVSVFLFDFVISSFFVFGAFLVMTSLFIYSVYQPKKQSTPVKNPDKGE